MKKILLISILLCGCSTAQQQAAETEAQKVGTDVKTYAQDLAVMLQTINGFVQVTAPVAKTLASQWGLLPTNSSQLSTFNQVVSTSAEVGADATALNGLLTAISTTGTVPAK